MSGPVDTGRVNSIKDSNRKPFRIMALDGGGVRAIIQATILRKLQKDFPNIVSEVDMFAGASAGSIVSAAMCNGLTPDQTYQMWMETAPKIFVEGIGKTVTTLDGTFGASYDASALEGLLSGTLGNKTLGELDKKILIPSFHVDPPPRAGSKRWHPQYFHNFPGSQWNELPLMEAVLRSAAAPTYFPIRNGFVDGGTFANNPSLAAISTALNNGIKLEDIVVFSISTGSNPKFISKSQYGSGNWGLAEWGPHIIDLLLDSNTESLDYTCSSLLQKQYMRLDPALPKEIKLDDAKELSTLVEMAEAVDLEPTKAWLSQYWKTETKACETEKQKVVLPPANGWCSIQ